MNRSPRWLAVLFVIALASACGQHGARTREPEDGGLDGGYVVTSDGGGDAGTCGRIPVNHLPAAVTCDHNRPASLPGDGGTAGAIFCTYDSDCTSGEDGRCIVKGTAMLCSYDVCFANSDCADAGGDCSCRDGAAYGANSCVPSNCQSDSDCGACGFCSPVEGGCTTIIGVVGYFCHTPADECLNDSDCNQSDSSLHCIFDSAQSSRWICGPLDCTG